MTTPTDGPPTALRPARDWPRPPVLWMGVGGEGAKFWMSVLVDLKNRGVRDVFFLVCDGLKGLPEVVANV